MLFNSAVYIFLFLPVVVLAYFALNRTGYPVIAKAWLVLASLFFYGYWNPVYLPLIILSILVNYRIGDMLNSRSGTDRTINGERRRRKLILTAGIVFNLGLLGYFKYADFFIVNLNALTAAELSLLHLALPLAISFFTFQQIAFIVDCYHDRAAEHDFLSYCLFVTFFPQLIAGPIVRHHEMMPQFMSSQNHRINLNNIVTGLVIFSIGLFKKVIIADSLAVWADAGFDRDITLSFLEAWGTSLSYTFQLYYDFSGYTDMAIGAALLLNIRLPVNFDSPYKAVSIRDFWRRWHITLSHWLRDHVYIPLGGNRTGTLRISANLFMTFLLGGRWHGAGWTFVAWGALHGTAMVVHRQWQQLNIRLPVYAGWFITFLFINITWVFFRATSFHDASRVLAGMFGLNGLPAAATVPAMIPDQAAAWIAVFALMAFLAPNSVRIIRYVPVPAGTGFTPRLGMAVATGLLAGIALSGLLATKGSEFLYFNF